MNQPASPLPAEDHDNPNLAIRRHTDRCFHLVEEFVPGPRGGFIVQGNLIYHDEVAEVRRADDPRIGDICQIKP